MNDDIIKYTKQTPIKNIIDDVLSQSYSKHSDLSHYLLEEEIDVVDDAIRQFALEIGDIKMKNKVLKMICFSNYPSYIKFYDINTDTYINYYDLEEIDRRYVEKSIEKWMQTSCTLTKK